MIYHLEHVLQKMFHYQRLTDNEEGMGLCMGNFQEPFSHTFIIVNTTALTIDYHIQISGKSHVLLYRAENGREKVDGNGLGRPGRITYRL